MSIKNASELPKRYFGLHMCEGVAQYDESGQPQRILVLENALKEMDPTMEGLPVYVHHVDDVNVTTLQNEADGYVVRSFFNQADGKHWSEFLVVSDRGHEAIRKKWKLSNAYKIKETRGGGKWHNVDYQQEVVRGQYEHLAIVPNPRYEESIILTPEEFKAYNSEKDQELRRLANSKEKLSMFKFFKRSKVENSAELEDTSVVLSSGREMTLKQVLNEMEAHEKEKENEGQEMMANVEHMVEVGEKKMKVNELVNAYQELMKKQAANPAEDEEAKKKALELAAHEQKEIEEKKNAEEKAAKEAEEKKQNALKEAKAKAEAAGHFEKLKNAANAAPKVLEISTDQVERGRQRYGSGK